MRVLAAGLILWSVAAGGISPQEAPAQESRGHWPQWRGPEANGASETANPPIEWGPEKNVKWKVAVPGQGSGSPIVWGERVYLLTALKTDRQQEPRAEAREETPEAPGGGRRGRARAEAPHHYYQFIVLCYDRESGEEIWRTVAAEEVPHEPGHETNSFASSSPVTDGKRLFVSFGSRGIFCFDMNGNKQWERDLGQMETRAGFGEGSSPALDGDVLIIPWDHEGDSSVIALDANSGRTLWESERDERTTWATPLITEYQGRKQVITNGTRVRSYDLNTGELLWECGGQVQNPIPSPIRFRDSVICMTGFRGNAIYSISLEARGDVTDTAEVLWSREDAAPYVPSAALYKGRLYLTKANNAIVTSIDAETGEVVIPQQRLPGIRMLYASPVAAAERIYFTGRDGTTVVIKHGDALEVLATNSIGEPVDASPALVGDELLLRSSSHLYCIAQP
ncbi:PQQ-binding-like beta-propeller repeat protein [Candidatus Laterigemmans baculatus]|uniref:PQQ-binding-like beta-propeller repeat protein n=1 Tax=Candidatus Laterigemmans baculatus TaxID=2770505 RepID=UPI0013DC3F51|nr:PQQ-binding-like beta-propeller repeat protein [Candidatus Laterigemmans baculatus]